MKTNPPSTLADYCSHNSLEDNQTCTQYLNVVKIKYKSILSPVNTARAVNTQIVYVYIMTCKHQHELHDSVYSNYRQIHHRYSELGYMSFTQLMRTSTKTVQEHVFFLPKLERTVWGKVVTPGWSYLSRYTVEFVMVCEDNKDFYEFI